MDEPRGTHDPRAVAAYIAERDAYWHLAGMLADTLRRCRGRTADAEAERVVALIQYERIAAGEAA